MSRRIVIAGGHGKIALLLERMLADRGDSVAGLVRNPEHADDLAAAQEVGEPANVEQHVVIPSG